MPEPMVLRGTLKAQDATYVGVVPNPARDQAALVLGRPLEQPGVLLVFDPAGKEVFRLSLPEGEPRTEFSTGSLASGLYQYRVESDGTAIGHGKLAITH